MIFEDKELKIKDIAYILIDTIADRSDIIRQKFGNFPINILTEPYLQGKYDGEILRLIGSHHSIMDKNILKGTYIFYYYDPFNMLAINTRIIIRMQNQVKL